MIINRKFIDMTLYEVEKMASGEWKEVGRLHEESIETAVIIIETFDEPLETT